MKKIFQLFLTITLLFTFTHCGEGIETTPTSGTTVNKSAFNLASPFPSDIDIVKDPNSPELENTAFVASGAAPYVIAVDLNSNPLSLSKTFKGLPDLPIGVSIGIPGQLWIADAHRGFLLTSKALVYFDPQAGSVIEIYPFDSDPLLLSSPIGQVDKNGATLANLSGTFLPSFPASLIVSQNKIAVSFSNVFYQAGSQLDHVAQGIVRFYEVKTEAPFIVPANPFYQVLSGYNATGLTLLKNGQLLATSTGVTQFQGDNSVPVTEGFVDLIDWNTGVIQSSLNLGMSAPAFRAWALTPDEQFGFLGSSSGSYVLEIRLAKTLELIHGAQNPIVLTSNVNGTDYVQDVLVSTDGKKLFAMSFNKSSVYTLSLENPLEPTLVGKLVNLSFSESLGTTGAGPSALRIGREGIDFNGADLWVLTGNPGGIAAIQTE